MADARNGTFAAVLGTLFVLTMVFIQFSPPALDELDHTETASQRPEDWEAYPWGFKVVRYEEVSGKTVQSDDWIGLLPESQGEDMLEAQVFLFFGGAVLYFVALFLAASRPGPGAALQFIALVSVVAALALFWLGLDDAVSDGFGLTGSAYVFFVGLVAGLSAAIINVGDAGRRGDEDAASEDAAWA